MRKQIVLASNNAGKLREFSAMFAPLGIDMVPQAQLGVVRPRSLFPPLWKMP